MVIANDGFANDATPLHAAVQFGVLEQAKKRGI